jgi:kynureninase
MTISKKDCVALDAKDPLASFRDRFALPDGTIYLDGNSLGALPKATVERVRAVTEDQWGADLIKSWNTHDWVSLPERTGGKIARLIGAKANEVIVADSTSVNLFKLLVAAVKARPDRRVILTEGDNFPTDAYIAQGVAKMLGDGYEVRHINGADALDAIDDSVAVVSLTHVNYKTGRAHDMAGITRAAHEAGALMLWDLAHSAGALPVDLNGAGADFAVGCGYKYLNGGPGAPAFLFVREGLQDSLEQPLSGWLGHARPFEFVTPYEPAPGIRRALCGTPPVISMSALDCSLDLMLEADMAAIREKSLALTDLFIDLVEQECGGHGFVNATPVRDQRGSQVGLTHSEGFPIMQALIARGVIGDFRAPDLLRFGFTPLYVRFVDAWDAVAQLKDIMDSGAWDKPEFKIRGAVT